jgi:hypothetical protein
MSNPCSWIRCLSFLLCCLVMGSLPIRCDAMSQILAWSFQQQKLQTYSEVKLYLYYEWHTVRSPYLPQRLNNSGPHWFAKTSHVTSCSDLEKCGFILNSDTVIHKLSPERMFTGLKLKRKIKPHNFCSSIVMAVLMCINSLLNSDMQYESNIAVTPYKVRLR